MQTIAEAPTLVYAGLDIAQASLQVDLPGQAATLPHSSAGHRDLIRRLRKLPAVHLVCEAPGGYERAVGAALQAAGLPVRVVNPAKVRHFALAQGRRAKTDPLDAAGLRAFGQALRPAATPLPDAALAEWRALVQWRQHLLAQKQAASQQAERQPGPFIRRQWARLQAHLERPLAAAEAELAAALARAPQWEAAGRQLETLAGVGRLTAVSVLSQRPELGRISRGRAAALAGLAPWPRQSGPWQGQRHIGGGRGGVRRALYMAAVAVARMPHTKLGQF